MRTVLLRGKKAAGRVALVDDEDYELVSQHKWCISEESRPGKRESGPYAIAQAREDGHKRTLRMHILIMGQPYIDHIDHDGLNNQRSNLRPATVVQNSRNSRPNLRGTSPYKGVYWTRNTWHASIRFDGRQRILGSFGSELEAAYAYDKAAREHFREFACINFPEGPTRAMQDQWEAERKRRRARVTNRKPEAAICRQCGSEFQSKSIGRKYYCSTKCSSKAKRVRRRAAAGAQTEGRLF